MGQNEKCTWDDRKQAINLATHGYDFALFVEVFDGRFLYTRPDMRFDYGELRYNSLAFYQDRLINITFTQRDGKNHLISIRSASRNERKIYDDQKTIHDSRTFRP